MPEPKFKVGDAVRRRSSPDALGIVKACEWEEQIGEWFYRVRFGTSSKGVRESDLEPVPDDADPWGDAASGSYSMSDAFRTRLTYERLRKPPSRIAASFGSARAAFYPYQFKPLLKFLENQRQRLLIADDVGLGKTIEAGYILREMRARHGLDRVLVVAPARLQTKWKVELERRFDEVFEVVRMRDLLRLRQALERNQDLDSFRWITSYEAARDPRVTELFDEFEPALDLVIFDEAHRMRNSGTAQHALGAALANCADAMVFLTATPVQTGLDNLFNLLRLLDPDEFSDFEVFRRQMEANRSIVRLANAIRSESSSAEDLLPLIAEIKSSSVTSQITSSEYFASIVARSELVGNLDRPSRIELQRDVAELSLTSHIISRTRKVEVLPDRPQRIANSLTVVLTDDERKFYDSVAELCRDLRWDLNDWGLAMATLMAYRYTASCIPAAQALFRERALQADSSPLSNESDEEDTEDSADTPSAVLTRELGVVASGADIQTDSKFDAFRAAIEEISRDDEAAGRAPRKIIVFSFFKRTLRYLSARLRQLNVDHRRIDGDMAIPDREVKIDEFASTPAVRVLLSSEVGSEGLDLQFASVVVNYDLPWNPMVVEQRIGRVDRLGQSSPTITIINLVADGTIEKRILLRLYLRIGIFEETIGDIDPILGEQIEKLTAQALRGTLSEEDQRTRVDQAAAAFVGQELEARKLGTDADALMAADQSFLDEVDSMIGKRRVPLPGELYDFVFNHLKNDHIGSVFPATLVSGSDEVRLSTAVAQQLRLLPERDSEVVRVARKIEGGKFFATFNQQAALVHARAELIHSRHPLVRLAADATLRVGSNARSFALRLHLQGELGTVVVPGIYAFSVWLYDLRGIRARTEIAAFFAGVGRNGLVAAPTADALYLQLLELAADLDPVPHLDPNAFGEAQTLLISASKEMRQALHARETSLNEARHLRKKATLDATYASRVNSARKRVMDLQRKGSAPFAIRMSERKLEIAEAHYKSAMSDLEAVQQFAIEDEEIAVGVVEVTA